MSILQPPRISFRGRITWDPIVTNNTRNFYDEATCEAALRPGETAQDFRSAAIGAVTGGGGNWNPDGTHRSVFFDTRVTSVNLGGGTVTDDPFVGQPVAFAGMLVDSEPYGSYSSQLFFDHMRFGIDGGARVLAPRRTRMTARRINFGRNLGYHYIASGASVMWQTAFHKSDGLIVDTHDSPALAAFAAALDDDDVQGLIVRWNAYRTVYFDTEDMTETAVANAATQALQAKLRMGGFQPNPARSELVGVLGVWRKGEPAAVGGDRFLPSVGTSPIASAYARLESNRVIIDLQNSIPEDGFDLTKHDYGDLKLVAQDPAKEQPDLPLATLAYADYDKTAYDLTGGFVELPVDPGVSAQATDWDLKLVSSDEALTYLVEDVRYACCASPNTYLSAGEAATIEVQILERGRRPTQPVELRKVALRVNAAGQWVPDGATGFTSDEAGRLDMPIEGKAGGGIAPYMLLAGNKEVPAALNVVQDPYCYVRSLPLDEHIAALEPTWDNVYQNIIINWHAMAPCMDNWLDLGNEAQMSKYASIIRRLTDPESFEEFRFMPVTRDITPGERTLLNRWLDTVSGGANLSGPGPAGWTLARKARNLDQSAPATPWVPHSSRHKEPDLGS